MEDKNITKGFLDTVKEVLAGNKPDSTFQEQAVEVYFEMWLNDEIQLEDTALEGIAELYKLFENNEITEKQLEEGIGGLLRRGARAVGRGLKKAGGAAARAAGRGIVKGAKRLTKQGRIDAGKKKIEKLKKKDATKKELEKTKKDVEAAKKKYGGDASSKGGKKPSKKKPSLKKPSKKKPSKKAK